MEYIINVMDLHVLVKANYNMLITRLSKYLDNDFKGEVDFKVTYDDNDLYAKAKENKHLSIDEVEYIISGGIFYENILKYNGMLLHSSVVVYDNKSYVFSGDSGSGKSTHTSLYLKYLEGSYILNDDKPALRLIDNKIYVYGTPYSGKYDISENKKVLLQGICFIKQGKINKIEKLAGVVAIAKLLKQTLIGLPVKLKNKMLDILDNILNYYDIYELTCDISKEAFETSYYKLKGDKHEN